MITKSNILISLVSRHATNIYLGNKTVEFRRRTLNLETGTVIWIYEKIPAGAITGRAIIKTVTCANPKELWKLYGSVSGLNETEFFEYFKGLDSACAIELKDVEQLDEHVLLSQLRQLKENFQPPQFFKSLNASDPILRQLMRNYQKTNISKKTITYFLAA